MRSEPVFGFKMFFQALQGVGGVQVAAIVDKAQDLGGLTPLPRSGE